MGSFDSLLSRRVARVCARRLHCPGNGASAMTSLSAPRSDDQICDRARATVFLASHSDDQREAIEIQPEAVLCQVRGYLDTGRSRPTVLLAGQVCDRRCFHTPRRRRGLLETFVSSGKSDVRVAKQLDLSPIFPSRRLVPRIARTLRDGIPPLGRCSCLLLMRK